jgi:group I intron endonuclease
MRDGAHRYPGVYEIWNLCNGDRYVGSAVNINHRWQRHKQALRNGTHGNRQLQEAWNVFGEEMFLFWVLLRCSREDVLFFEQRALDQRRRSDWSKTYNKAFDAMLPARGLPVSAEWRKKISVSVRAACHRPDVKEKRAAAQKLAWAIPEIRANRIAALQRVWDDPDHRAKMSASQVRAKKTSAYKMKMSISMKSAWQARDRSAIVRDANGSFMKKEVIER